MTDKDLQQLISLSEVMLKKANDQMWEEVILLEAERRDFMEQFFSNQIPLPDAGPVADAVDLILSIDKQIIELGAVKRFDILQALQEMEQGKKAVKAYSS